MPNSYICQYIAVAQRLTIRKRTPSFDCNALHYGDHWQYRR